MAGGKRATEGTRYGTPRGELERIDEDREQRSAETRERMLAAMLEAAGERGYRRLAVQDVIDRYEGNRVQFYRCFSSKADCFAEAYETHAGRLAERVLAAAAEQPDWRRGVRAALDALAAFATEGPLLARGLVVEVQVAGGPSLKARAEALGRFERALDLAREEAGPRHAPPPLTASFLAGAVESALAEALAGNEPDTFAAAVPELAHVIVAAYLGEDAAGEELKAAAAA